MRDDHKKVTHAAVFSGPATAKDIKPGLAQPVVQFHFLLGRSDEEDRFHGVSDEHDRLTAMMTELHHLDQRVREEAQEVFARHGFADNGFFAFLRMVYVESRDSHK
jgi:hypothetical protein